MDSPATLEKLDKVLAARRGGIMLVTGPSANRNSTFVYALLQRINQTENRIIYILERNLSFLMKHDKSVIVQTETETDVDTLEKGIENGCSLMPDVMYVKDIRTREELLKALEAAEMNILVIIDETALDETTLFTEFEAQRNSIGRP